MDGLSTLLYLRTSQSPHARRKIGSPAWLRPKSKSVFCRWKWNIGRMAKLQESTRTYDSACFHGRHSYPDIDQNLLHSVVGLYLQWLVGHTGIYGGFAIAEIDHWFTRFTDLSSAHLYMMRAIVAFFDCDNIPR